MPDKSIQNSIEVRETALKERLQRLRDSFAGRFELIGELETYLRSAPDESVVRINPFRYAAEHSRDEAEIVDLFLHARKAGLVVMEWQYVCRVCGTIVESFDALSGAGEHFFCKACVASREADLSDYVEIGFTVSKAVRVSRFHDPASLSAGDFLFRYGTSAAALARDGTELREFYSRHQRITAYVEPNENRVFRVDLKPGFYGLTPGPEIIVTPSSDNRLEVLEFTHREGRTAEPMIEAAPGLLEFKISNESPERVLAVVLEFSAEELPALIDAQPGVRLGNFLSGARLLSTQTFLDLFPTETVMSAGGLAVKRVALLFTDIQGATALYDRVGDMKAFGLVRQHFGVLREVIEAHRGALVKTIGDAVMASFHNPPDAVRAALDMRNQIRRFNESAGEDLITLKIGAHAGPCIAVTLNERLDYFGQTVNLAARAQELASANEICITDSLYRLVEGDESVVGLQRETRAVHFKGIEREVSVQVLGCERESDALLRT